MKQEAPHFSEERRSLVGSALLFCSSTGVFAKEATLCSKELDYYCCDGVRGKDSWGGCTYLGKAKTQSKKGERAIPYNPCGEVDCFFEVPLGYYFLVNPHPDSYDSRYLGPIERSRVLFILRPLG